MNYSSIHKLIATGLVASSTIFSTFAQVDIDTPRADPASTFLLTDYVDDFDNGTAAAGESTGFGAQLGTFALVEGQGRSVASEATDVAAHLATVSGGFGTATGETAIGFAKNIATVLLSDNATAASIDASVYNALSYFVKNETDNSASSVTVALELVIGDGGGSPGSTTGSTWAQTTPVNLADLTDSGNNNGFSRVVLKLAGTTAGVADGFIRTAAPGTGGGHTELDGTILDEITEVKIVMVSNGDNGVPRGIYVDDINFFDNVSIEVAHVDRVFAKSGTSGVFTLVAILDRNGSPADGLEIAVLETGNGEIAFPNGPISGTSGNNTGEVTFTYSVPSLSEVTEITVQLAD